MFQRNKTVVILSIVVGTLAILVIALLLVLAGRNNQPSTNNVNDRNTIGDSQPGENNQVNTKPTQNNQNEDEGLVWRQGASGYEAMGTAPTCDEPLEVRLPVDINDVTSILYPGQTRGGNYKPHGGFRFDNNTTNVIDVTAPMDGYVVTGARYIADGEIQYTFDFIHPCGIMYRLGHIRELTPKFQAFAEAFPAATADSRTTNINPPVMVEAGELIGTKVGIIDQGNVFLDYGVFDLRQKNEASQDPSYATISQGNSLASNALCWLDYVEDPEYIKGLPAGDPTSGKNSDYCN